jgi:predicted nuclease of restriction endonuclease-like (RecB) superfamily
MKKTLTLIFVLVSLSVFGQKVDSVKNALQVNPVVVNALQKDTCYQLTWSVFSINRNDTTSGANSYVQLYDRKAKRIQEMNVHIPYSVLSVWLEDKIMDDYILTFLGLKKR